MEVEEEGNVMEDDKGFKIMESELDAAIKEMKNGKAVGGNVISRDNKNNERRRKENSTEFV